MLKQLISRNYHFAKKNTAQILNKVLTNYRKIRRNDPYCLEVNKRRIGFSLGSDYQNQDCNEIIKANKNNDPYKSIEEWNVVSYFLLMVGIIGYLLVNNKASSDAEEDDNKIDGSDLQLREKLRRLSIKLVEGLPEPVENYVDFQGKKELLDEELKKQDIIVISGTGGMGKSTLVAQYAHEYQQRGYMQAIWIKGTQIEEEFFRLAVLLEIETNGLDSELIRNLVYGNLQMLFGRSQILFIFDNVETREKIEKHLINLPNTAKVIITARNESLLDGIKTLRVEGFKKEEAIFYLKKGLKISEEDAEKMIHVVGESPFRLSQVAAYVKNYPLKSIDELTQKYLQILKGYGANEEIYPEVEMLFRNLKEDSPRAWELLKYLAYLDAEGVSVGLIGTIMDQTVNELEEAINKLKELSLVQANERKVKVTHRIVQGETKKALNEEDKSQCQKILDKLLQVVDREFPKVNANPDNWKEVMEIIGHAKMLIEETKEVNQTIASRTSLLSKIGAYFYYINFNYKEAINYWEELLNNERNIHTEDHQDVANSLDNIGLAYKNLGGAENVKIGLQYLEASLKMRQVLFSGKHADVASSLNNVGATYEALGGEENAKKGIQYQKASLIMLQELYPGNHPDVASALNNVGLAYKCLGGEEDVKKGLQYQEASLKMMQELYPGNHPHVAILLSNVGRAYKNLGGEENVKKGLQYLEISLKMLQELYSGQHPDIAISLNNVGRAYEALGGDENVKKGLQYQEASLKMMQVLYSDNHPNVATLLGNVGKAYNNLKGEENLKKGLQYLEASLKMTQKLFPDNHPDVAKSLNNVGIGYQKLGDCDKALEYWKQAYGIYLFMFNEDYTQTKEIKSVIESLQPDFFVNQGAEQILQQQSCLGGNRIGPECRWMIVSRQTMNDELITLKQGIQQSVLNDIVKIVDDYGWTNIGLFGSEYGVKKYIEQRYLESKLKRLGNNSGSNDIKLAQMLCFESINLGIMKSKRKPYEVVEGFTRDNSELVRKIAVEHPEFFVDGSIVEACIKAMPNDKSFEEHLLKHVKYMGMESRKERGIKKNET